MKDKFQNVLIQHNQQLQTSNYFQQNICFARVFSQSFSKHRHQRVNIFTEYVKTI